MGYLHVGLQTPLSILRMKEDGKLFLERCKSTFFYNDSIAGKPETAFFPIDLKYFRGGSKKMMKRVVAK